VRTVMTPPGYVIIPLDADETAAANAHWRFGWSRDHTHLSPVTVSKTLHTLVRRVLKTQPERWKVLPFDMEADRSPVAGKTQRCCWHIISMDKYFYDQYINVRVFTFEAPFGWLDDICGVKPPKRKFWWRK